MNKRRRYTYFQIVEDCKNHSNLHQFENDILELLYQNNISNVKIMQAYTFIYNNKFIKKETCFQFRNIYKNVINFLLEQIVIQFDEDLSIFRRRIQLQLHKYHMKKKIIDKMFFNFNYCFCNKCFSTMGTISEIHDNLFKIKFQNAPDYVMKYDSKKIKEYIKNCKNSLILKSKLIDSNEFFKRNIFCYF